MEREPEDPGAAERLHREKRRDELVEYWRKAKDEIVPRFLN